MATVTEASKQSLKRTRMGLQPMAPLRDTKLAENQPAAVAAAQEIDRAARSVWVEGRTNRSAKR